MLGPPGREGRGGGGGDGGGGGGKSRVISASIYIVFINIINYC